MSKPAAEDSGDAQVPAGAGNMIRRWLPVLCILAAMATAWFMGWHEHLTLSELIRNRQDLASYVSENLVTAVLAYILLYAVAVALSFPGASLLTIAGGFLFGWLISGTATVVAATLGATVIYLAARSSLGSVFTRRAGPFVERLASGFRENAFSYLLFLRLTPVFPFWLVNIAPAIFHVPLATYVGATLIGIVPGTYAFAFIGAGLDSVIAAQEAANPGCAAAGTCHVELGALVTPELLAAFFALGIASLVPVALKKIRNRGAGS
ncbi:VTT domain-containing protein [uncultured Roseibium sp.]|uniref:TVP38/TMEM64 family protein n=1 Tax=uncultured Roseibium sp. TaxID=1936171 RepID=UPI0025986649|nr:VTT domain-containing protein [uncultured Roseibium sp.]